MKNAILYFRLQYLMKYSFNTVSRIRNSKYDDSYLAS